MHIDTSRHPRPLTRPLHSLKSQRRDLTLRAIIRTIRVYQLPAPFQTSREDSPGSGDSDHDDDPQISATDIRVEGEGED